jgi:hypothetical protein
MSRRIVRAAMALAFVLTAATLHALPMQCYYGAVVATPEGYSECWPGLGQSCYYCEVHP